ncbi:MAG TPA: hypothetical protein EYN06_08850, partial [Myxococcales bacterium]|nr:hypothetical protein [Myxococcales bacterium]
AAGINALALTEYDRIPDLDEVAATSKKLEFPIFVGIDIDTDDGRVLAFAPDPSDARFSEMSWDPGDGPMGIKEVLGVMDELGGAVIAMHPYLDDGGPYLGDRIYKMGGLSGVEVVCGIKQHLANDSALEAASALGLPTIGGSDTGPEGQRLGRFATAFSKTVSNQEELVGTLIEGGYWAVEIGEPGEASSRTRPRPRPRQRGGRGPRGPRQR